jgi:hypothetical protein
MITKKDLHTPLSEQAIRKIYGAMHKFIAYQAVAASANLVPGDSPVIVQAGRIQDIHVVIPKVCASGESMVVDVHKSTDGGATYATVLTETKTIGSTDAAKTLHSMTSLIDGSKADLNAGDMLRVVLTYTAGGGPTPIVSTTVQIEIGPR